MKKKILALTMASAIMIMGAGYAAWNDSVRVNATVSTGNVDVDWHWQGWHADEHGVYTTNATGNSVRSADGKGYTITLGNMYPGAVAKWDAQMINNGTLPVKFVSAEITNLNDVAHLRDFIQVKYDTRLYNKTTWSGYNVSDWMSFDAFLAAVNADADLKGYVVPAEGGRIQFGALDLTGETEVVPPGAEPNCIQFRLDPNAPESLCPLNSINTIIFLH